MAVFWRKLYTHCTAR